MRQLRALLLRFKGLFLKDARERELAAELESHLQMHIDDNIRAGMSPQDARRVAVMKLGGLDQTKEAYRDRSTIPFLESVVQDLRFTLRQLRKNPAVHCYGDHDGSARNRGQRGDLCLRRCRAYQTSALSKSIAFAVCD